MLKVNISILFLTLTVLSCSHKEPKKVAKSSVNSLAFLKKFNQASRHLDKLDYSQSIKLFKEILASPVPKRLQSLVWYNLGWSYESIGSYRAANKCYRNSILRAKKTYQKLKALSFVRLAYTYRFLNQPDKGLSALLEAYKAKKYLPYFVSNIQLPIHLGSIYWVLGNEQLAKKFFLEAEKNILTTKIKYRDPKKKIDIIAKAFYLSSKLPRWSKKYKSINKYVEELFVLQIYLLRATALNSPQWSEKASKELLKSYKLIFQVLKGQKNNKEFAKYKALKKSTLYNLNKVLASTKDLKTSQNLKSFQVIKSAPLKELIKQLKQYKVKLQTR